MTGSADDRPARADRRRHRRAGDADRACPHLDLHVASRQLADGRPPLAGAGARGRGPASDALHRAADPALRRPADFGPDASLRDRGDHAAIVDNSGEVAVDGHLVGHIDGLNLTIVESDLDADRRLLTAAARRAALPALRRKVAELVAAARMLPVAVRRGCDLLATGRCGPASARGRRAGAAPGADRRRHAGHRCPWPGPGAP